MLKLNLYVVKFVNKDTINAFFASFVKYRKITNHIV